MQITYIAKRWGHHTKSGGYDRLAREIEGSRIIGRPGYTSATHRMLRFLWRRFWGPQYQLIDYGYEDWLAEWGLLLKSQFNAPGLVHVLYGDEQLDIVLRHRKLLKCPLIATFHVPISITRERFEKYHRHLLSGLDAVIVVSNCQINELSEWFGKERLAYVPHGIDVDVFTPGSDFIAGKPVRFVTVGNHMRDWEALHRIIDRCNQLCLPVEFDIVLRKNYWSYLTGCQNVNLLEGLSEGDLVNVYRRADALVIPLIDATANNSILESMACGTPVISTKVGGIPDYVDETSGWLFGAGEVEGIVELIVGICRDRAISLKKRTAARKKAMDFSWSKVAGQCRLIYAETINRFSGRSF